MSQIHVLFIQCKLTVQILYSCLKGEGVVAAWPAEWEQDVAQKQAASFEPDIFWLFIGLPLSTEVYDNNSIIV